MTSDPTAHTTPWRLAVAVATALIVAALILTEVGNTGLAITLMAASLGLLGGTLLREYTGWW